jgi:hypothetical protein
VKASKSEFLSFEGEIFFPRLIFWGAVGIWILRSKSIARVVAELVAMSLSMVDDWYDNVSFTMSR